jgi:hypothetical protein
VECGWATARADIFDSFTVSEARILFLSAR